MWATSKGAIQAGVESKSSTVYGVASLEIANNSLVFLANRSRITSSKEVPGHHIHLLHIQNIWLVPQYTWAPKRR